MPAPSSGAVGQAPHETVPPFDVHRPTRGAPEPETPARSQLLPCHYVGGCWISPLRSHVAVGLHGVG